MKILKIVFHIFDVLQFIYHWVNDLVKGAEIFSFMFWKKEMFIFDEYRFYTHDEINKKMYTNYSECSSLNLKASHRSMNEPSNVDVKLHHKNLDFLRWKLLKSHFLSKFQILIKILFQFYERMRQLTQNNVRHF